MKDSPDPVTPEIKNSPKYKPFFDAITTILAEMKKQNSRSSLVVALPKMINMLAVSNYGITVQHWFDHNFGNEYGIKIDWI